MAETIDVYHIQVMATRIPRGHDDHFQDYRYDASDMADAQGFIFEALNKHPLADVKVNKDKADMRDYNKREHEPSNKEKRELWGG